MKTAGPIDPQIELLAVRDPAGRTLGVFSNFALHLDTVGGSKWSADYPNFIDATIKRALGPEVISIFGTGCCGDINHIDPTRTDRNRTDFIGNAILLMFCQMLMVPGTIYLTAIAWEALKVAMK